MIIAVINYCSAANGDTSGTGLMGQVNDVSSVLCSSGYIASFNGAPTYQCTANSATGGVWAYAGGSCGVTYCYLLHSLSLFQLILKP